MATAMRTISHEDRLSLVDHLDELRTRLIISMIALVVAFGLCFWQNHALLSVLNKPLQDQTQKSLKKGRGPLGATSVTQQAVLQLIAAQTKLNGELVASGAGPALRAQVATANAALLSTARHLAATPAENKPVTLGIGEPFTNTVTIAFYFALLFSLPIILFQLYGFILPAFSPKERKVALPLMLAVPVLFTIGVTFGYFVVLPASVKFFQNFNSDSFNVLVQAQPYYKFALLILIAMGAIFQVPVGILAITRAGIVTPKQLRANRRYAVVIAAVIAALLPGDVVTMGLETLPLLVLFEGSIVVASVAERRAQRRGPEEADTVAVPAPVPETGPPSTPSTAPIPPVNPPPHQPSEDDDAL